jgi:aspartate 1-decarboxylase
MLRTFCKSKIVNAQVTGKDLNYSGSIGIDKVILGEADMMPGEQVHVLNLNNGQRFMTYVIEEEENSGKIVLYGPASRLGETGDGLVILSYCLMETKESHNLNLRVVALEKGNKYKSK